MSLHTESNYYEKYYDHVLNRKRSKGAIAKVFNLINDLSDRRGLSQEWDEIDGDIQDEIIEKWLKIVK